MRCLFTTIPCNYFPGRSFGSIAKYAFNRQTGFRKGELMNPFVLSRDSKINFIHQMLVVGSLFQISAFFIQFLEPSFPIFVLSFALAGIGMSFQVSIQVLKYVPMKNYRREYPRLLGCICERLHCNSSKRL